MRIFIDCALFEDGAKLGRQKGVCNTAWRVLRGAVLLAQMSLSI
jgi:hypothetical protein